VLIATLLNNIGKIVPAFVYRNEASWRERLAVAIAMFPSSEVGAGVLIISMSYSIGGMIVTISMFSLALNLLLTGVFIVVVKRLLQKVQHSSI
jgi:Kef-type K+ transport system membrane component KefB